MLTQSEITSELRSKENFSMHPNTNIPSQRSIFFTIYVVAQIFHCTHDAGTIKRFKADDDIFPGRISADDSV